MNVGVNLVFTRHSWTDSQDRLEQDTPGYQTNIYFEYATKAANWLKSLAVQETNGAYKWPTTGSSDSYTIGIDSGAAGGGMLIKSFCRCFTGPGGPMAWGTY